MKTLSTHVAFHHVASVEITKPNTYGQDGERWQALDITITGHDGSSQTIEVFGLHSQDLVVKVLEAE